MVDDRPSAVLTKGQREYLRGDRTPAQERTTKSRIRQRILTSVQDLALLHNSLSEDDLKLIREEIETSSGKQATDFIGNICGVEPSQSAKKLREVAGELEALADTIED
jgi:hypothetical protein